MMIYLRERCQPNSMECDSILSEGPSRPWYVVLENQGVRISVMVHQIGESAVSGPEPDEFTKLADKIIDQRRKSRGTG
jgi:hypothetical protein